MGTDCVLKVDGEKIVLDRWYCFSEFFDHDKEYSKVDFLERVNMCILSHVDEFEYDVKFGSDSLDSLEDLLYRLSWCYLAKNKCGEVNKFEIV